MIDYTVEIMQNQSVSNQTQAVSNISDTFVVIANNVTNTFYTYLTNITSVATHSFRVTARNVIGYSQYSPVLEIISATTPSAPEAPTTSNFDDDYILIRWKEPADDGGSPIIGYKIEI